MTFPMAYNLLELQHCMFFLQELSADYGDYNDKLVDVYARVHKATGLA